MYQLEWPWLKTTFAGNVVVPVPFVVNEGDEQKHEPIEDLKSSAKDLFARLESEAGSGKTR